MRRGTLVRAPDGSRWLVRRRWLDRPVPRLTGRWRARRRQVLEGAAEIPFGPLDLDLGAVIGTVVVLLLIVFVLLPLLSVALEVIALVFVLFSGLVGRVVLGRPWIVEADPQGSDAEPIRIPVKGFRRAGEAVNELERGIAASGPPHPAMLSGRTY